MPRRRFLRISYPDQSTFLSFNPERIESVCLDPYDDEEVCAGDNDKKYMLTIMMGSGTPHTIVKDNFAEALVLFCKLSGAPPPDTSFDDLTKSYFPIT